MFSKLRKTLSILLVVVFLAGLAGGFPLTVAAEEPPAPASSEVEGDSSVPPEDEGPGDEIPETPDDAEDLPSDEAGEGGKDPSEDEDVPTSEISPEDTGEEIEAENEVFFDAESAVAAAEEDSADSVLEKLYNDPDSEQQQVREKNSPYGDSFAITSSEFFTGGTFSNDAYNAPKSVTQVYGHNTDQQYSLADYGKKQTTQMMKADQTLLDLSTGDLTVAMEGDFAGTGRDNCVALLVYRGATSGEQHQIEIYEGDATPSATLKNEQWAMMYNPVGTLAPPSGSFISEHGNNLLSETDGMAELHLATGDLNGDGLDEIIVLVPHYVNDGQTSQLLVYASVQSGGGRTWAQVYKKTLDIGFGRYDNADTDADNTLYTRRSHSLTVGDLDRDGCDDVVLAGSELQFYKKTGKSNVCHELQLVYGAKGGISGGAFAPSGAATYGYSSDNSRQYDNALFGANENDALLELPTVHNVGREQYSWLKEQYPDSQPVTMNDIANGATDRDLLPTQLGVSLADVDGGAGVELLLGYNILYCHYDRPLNEIKNYYYLLGYQVYTMAQTTSTNDELASTNLLECLIFKENLISKLTTSHVLIVPTVTGSKDTYYIYDCDLWEYTLSSIRLTAARIEGPKATPRIIVGGFNQHYVSNEGPGKPAYRLDTGNLETSHYLYPTALMGDFYPKSPSQNIVYSVRPATVQVQQGITSTLQYGYVVQFLKNAESGSFARGKVFTYFVSVSDSSNFNITGWNAGWKQGKLLGVAEPGEPFFYALPDTDHDSLRLDFKSYNLVHTDPVILAALAASPYYADAAALEMETGGTSYSYSIGTERTTTKGSSTSHGAYVSAQMSLGCDAIKFVAETEISGGQSISKESAFSQSTSIERTYDTNGEDSVVLASWPVDIFEYEMTYPTNNEGTEFVTTPYIISIPYSPSESLISLEQYNELYETYPDILPNLDAEVFTHTAGYPSSYPRSANLYRDVFYDKDNWSSFTPGNSGSSTHTLTIESSNTESTTTTNYLDFSVGVGVAGKKAFFEGQVTAGYNLGKEWSSGTSVSNSKGNSYSGTVCNTPQSQFNSFQWKLMQYNYYGKQNFPVVTYLVQPGTNYYPKLPEYYGIDESKTTKNTVAIHWTPSPEDVSPGISSTIEYLVYETSSQTPEPLRVAYTYDYNTGYYTLLDTGRSSGSKYTYEIRCRTRDGQNWTVPTARFDGYTNPADGTFAFTTQPKDMTIHPGQTPAPYLSASLSIGSFSGSISYNWQHLVKNEWQPITNDNYFAVDTTAGTLTFKSPAAGLAGCYRVIATLSWEGGGAGKTKQFVSDEAVVSYSKHGVNVTVSLPATNTDSDSFTIGARVVPAVNFGGGAPSGDVMFTLTHPSGAKAYAFSKEAVNSEGYVEVELSLPQNGIYMVEATYLGDGTYGIANSDKSRFTKNADNNMLSLSSNFSGTSFTYGDSQSVTVTQYTGGSGGTSTGNVDLTLSRHSGNAWTEVSDPGSWLTTIDGTGFKIIFADVGRYRLEITMQNASNVVYHEFQVTPRPVTFKIADVLKYVPKWTPSSNDLSMSVTSGSILPEDEDALKNQGYKKDNLGVFATSTSAEPINLDAATLVGTYAIRLLATGTATDNTNVLAKYRITVENGTYRIMQADTETEYVSVEYYKGGGNERCGIQVITPAGLKSKELVPSGSKVMMRAIASDGYEFVRWDVYMSGDVVPTPHTTEILVIESLTKNNTSVAVFRDAVPRVSEVTVLPASPVVLPGNKQQFAATVSGGRSAEVEWSLSGASSLNTYIGSQTGLLHVAKDETGPITVKATSVEARKENPARDISGQTLVSIGSSGVNGVSLTRIDASVPRGVSRQFYAKADTKTGTSAQLHWSVNGQAAGLGTTISLNGRLQVAADEPVGTVLTVRATSVVDSSKYDEQLLTVTDAALTGELTLSETHATITETHVGGYRININAPTHVTGFVAAAYPVNSNRAEPSGNVITRISGNRLVIDNGGAKAGESYVVRVTAQNDSRLWAECRVDYIVRTPDSPENLEYRATAKTVSFNAYSTADILVPMYRIVDSERVAWSVLFDDALVTLDQDNNPPAVVAAFEERLEKVNESCLRLVPTSSEALWALKSSYAKVKLKLTYKYQDAVDSEGNEILTSDFTLKVTKKKPTVKAKTVILDTWADAAEGTPLLTGATVIRLDPVSEPSARVKSWLTISEDGLHYGVGRNEKRSTTLKMIATLKGWNTTVRVNIPIKAVNTKPGLKLKSATAQLYATRDMSVGASMQLVPKSKTDTLAGLEVSHISVEPNLAEAFEVQNWNPGTGTFTLAALENPTNKTFDLIVWFKGGRASQTLKLPVKVRVVKSTPKLKAAKTSLTLNSTVGESYDLPLSSTIADVDLGKMYVDVALNGNNNAGLSVPEVLSGNGVVRFATGENPAAKATNKYTVRLWARNPGNDTSAIPLHRITVKVSTSSAEAAATLSAKGKLDISKSKPTPVTLTAKMRNYQNSERTRLSDVKFVTYFKNKNVWELVHNEATEEGDRLFTITRTSSSAMTWTVLPAAEADIRPGSYRVGIVGGSIPDSEATILSPLTTFTVTASKPKVSVSGAVTLYRGDPYSEQVVLVRLAAGSRNIASIELKNRESDNMYFEMDELGAGYVAIRFREGHVNKKGVGAITAARSATLTLNLRLEGNGNTTTLTTAKIKVVVV